jgi:Tol biopolymer transport system component
MSPEQARGIAVDRRCDIWAFGCVCFEMLSGQRAFDGSTFSDTVAAVLAREPDWSLLPAATPVSLRRLLRRCLEKDPRRRLRDIADARADLDDAAAIPSAKPSTPRRSLREYGGWVVAALLAVAVVYAAPTMLSPRNSTSLPISRTSIVLPINQRLAAGEGAYPLALSPDGRTIAYVADIAGDAQLVVRELAALETSVLAGTSGAAHPFFSPDGAWIGFFAGGALQKIAVAGGPPVRLCAIEHDVRGASWSSNGTIVWASRGELLHVDADGGTPLTLRAGVPGAWPFFLPDGETVLITVEGGFALLSLDGGPARIFARSSSALNEGAAVLGAGGELAQAQYVSSGHVVFGQAPGIVRALPFDVSTGEVTGTVVSLLDSLERSRNAGAVYFAASSNGTLVYASTGRDHQLVTVDRSGFETTVLIETADYRRPQVSPDGRRILVAANDETRRSDLWLIDAVRGTRARLTTTGHNLGPVWSPDGTSFLFNQDGVLAVLDLDGSAQTTVVSRDAIHARVPGAGGLYPRSWSPDGQSVIVQADEEDLWVLVPKAAALDPLLVRASRDFDGVLSPDGEWLAFASDESGREEVYVIRFPSLRDQTVVSTDGGRSVVWSRDGSELFYRRGDDVMVATFDGAGGVTVGRPQLLFSGPYFGAGRQGDFDVTPDGQRFVMVRSDAAAQLQQLSVVQNWSSELAARVPSY